MKPVRVLQLGLGIAIGAGGLYIFLRDVNASQLLHNLKECHPAGILVALGLAVLTIWFRALRWKIILPDLPPASKQRLFEATMIGFMANNIFPARMGEAARALLVWKKNGYPAAVAIGSVIIERVIDTIVYLLFFAVPVLLIGRLGGILLHAALILAACSCTIIFLLAFYAASPAVLARAGNKAIALFPPRWRTRVKLNAQEVISNLNWVFSMQKILAMIALSFLVGVCYVFMIMAISRSIHPLGFLESMFCESLATFGAAIPLTPGYIGTLHATMSYGITLCGVDRDSAAALTLLFHALGYIPTTVLGLYYFFRLNVSYKEISSAKDTLKSAKTPKQGSGRRNDS